MKRRFLVLLFALTCNVRSQINFVWGRQFGSDKEDISLNTAVDQKGNVFLAGNMQGNLFNSILGEHDIFIVKYGSDRNWAKPWQLWSALKYGLNRIRDLDWHSKLFYNCNRK